jgi:hypothetical protein
MAEQIEFEFPDEKEAKGAKASEQAVDTGEELEIEVVDDTPESDKGREPSEPPSEVTEDELENYSEKVKKRIQHLSKGYHDERRAKEAAAREREEAIRYAQQVFEENKRLKTVAYSSDKQATEASISAAEAELIQARAKFKKAYEDGDADLLASAQEEIADAKIKITRVKDRLAALPDEHPFYAGNRQHWLTSNSSLVCFLHFWTRYFLPVSLLRYMQRLACGPISSIASSRISAMNM